MTSERAWDWADSIAQRLIRRAARRAPASLSERFQEEWLADLAAQRGPIARLRFKLLAKGHHKHVGACRQGEIQADGRRRRLVDRSVGSFRQVSHPPRGLDDDRAGALTNARAIVEHPIHGRDRNAGLPRQIQDGVTQCLLLPTDAWRPR